MKDSSPARAVDTRRFPPPGQPVDIGAYRLHLMGAVHTGGPTTLLAYRVGTRRVGAAL